jgi:hypothetical protein
MPAGGRGRIVFFDDDPAEWCDGKSLYESGRVSVRTRGTDSSAQLRSFVINAREICIETDGPCEEVEIRLYLDTHNPFCHGRVDVQSGASVTLESQTDRTTLSGNSSFALGVSSN